MTQRLLLFLVCCLTTWTVSAQLSTITSVELEFAATGGATVTATASDSGSGLVVDDSISLSESTEYTLSIKLFNGSNDITSEVTTNADQLQFFFDPSEGVLADGPSYDDMDSNMLPLGLSSTLTGNCVFENDIMGTFRVALKDLGNQKDANSTIDDGTAIFDLSWVINIVEDANAPECENEEEVIDKVTLTFTPVDGGDPVVAVASDPDGPGPMDLMVEDFNLVENTEYELSIKLENTMEGEDITAEIMEEDDEHQFFFAWTGDIFSQPMGDGNIDNRDDPVNYNDQDDNMRPVGLSTNWTTSGAMSAGTFRVVLKHQPGIKSDTSDVDDGGTDIDITWNVNTVVTSTSNNLRPDQSLTIAPNPVRDNLYFLTENVDLSQATIVIFNSVGAQVRTLRNPSNEINISNLSPGMYTVQIKGEQLRWNGRFIKTTR